MQRSLVVLVAVMLALGWCPIKAQAATYSLSASGTLATLTSDNNSNSTGCGTIAGDSYDKFCPSGSCICITYSGMVSGRLTGTDPAGALHLTVDDGADATPDCRPVFGELIFNGSSDKETIYLNGSLCPNLPAVASFNGGWGTFSSSKSLKAFGTFSGTLSEQTTYSITLSGKTQ